MPEPVDALVIGAGPAGLMAAESLSREGRRVVVAEGKPTAGRKFLMAGKSGLNLTKDEPIDAFVAAYGGAADWLRPMLARMGPDAVIQFSRDLGCDVFTGSSGRVFPRAMKASPLLRAWLGRIGAEVRLGWSWTGWGGDAWRFDTRDGPATLAPEVVVLALGGASWQRLGSDGAWAARLAEKGVPIAPFRPANMGFRIRWSNHMHRHFGAPVKGVALRGSDWIRGEFVISRHGVEGGGIYAVAAAVRDGAPLVVDLLPDRTVSDIAQTLSRRPGKRTLARHLDSTLGLGPTKRALLQEFGRPLPGGAGLARLIKALPLRHDGPAPLDQAISTAGGVPRDALTEGLMLHALPGVFCAGEMLDWEAPTGGYLITGCLATGAWAGRAAAAWGRA